MAQTKKQKQQKALNRLLAELQAEKESRAHLQAQRYKVVCPSNDELRLSMEINNIKRAMGLNFQDQESPF
jgi:hypothetical protein